MRTKRVSRFAIVVTFSAVSLCTATFSGRSIYARTITVHPVDGGEYSSIQSAVDAAEDGDTIAVAAGEYIIDRPIDFNPGASLVSPIKNLHLVGIEGAENTTIRMQDPLDPENASVIVFRTLVTRESTVQGFTITGGSGTFGRLGLGPEEQLGGGVFCEHGSPTFSDCVITDNVADTGGGVCTHDAGVRLVRCTITQNVAAISGGGLYVNDNGEVSTEIENCDFLENVSVGGHGGAIAFGFTGISVTESRFRRNVAQYGGATSSTAGGLHAVRCVFAENQASGEGGGAIQAFDSRVWLENSLVYGNSSDEGAGAVKGIWDTAGTIHHCTFASNRSPKSEVLTNEIEEFIVGPIQIRDSIFWNHEGPSSLNSGRFVTVESSCVEGGAEGEGNIDADPLFESKGEFDFTRTSTIVVQGTEYVVPAFVTTEPNFRLREGSPAIDGGRLTQYEVDFDRHERPCGGAMDMGAFESGGCPIAVPFRRGDANEDGAIDLSDPITVLTFLFLGGVTTDCERAFDMNASGVVDLSDAVFGLNFLFSGGSFIPGSGSCGFGGDVALSCTAFDCQ